MKMKSIDTRKKEINGKFKGKKRKLEDENISSSDSEFSDRNDSENDSSDDETANEKRLRLAKQYLKDIEKEEQERAETEEIDRSAISHRLKEEVLERDGRLQKKVADEYDVPSEEGIRVLRGHKLPLTCLVVSSDNKFIYSAAKDCCIIKWDLQSGKKVKIIKGLKKSDNEKKGHSVHVLCLAISSDNKFLVSGCRKNLIHVWNPDTLDHIHTFTGHRDAISGLAFRKGTHQLFSGSHDRSVKIWNLDEMAYVETLFGHQDHVTSVDSLSRDRAITSGGRDNSIRVWKVVEETQLVFNGHISNIDCVRLVNEESFVACGDDGVITLWSVMKKRPLATVTSAHGINAENKQPNWIIAVAPLQNTDLVASGSNDGLIRLWKCGEKMRTLTSLFTIPQKGFVNALQFTSDGDHLVAAIGQEHRLGRWWRDKEARNSIVVYRLNRKAVNSRPDVNSELK